MLRIVNTTDLHEDKKSMKRRRIQRILAIAVPSAILLVTLLLFISHGKDVISFITDPERVRSYVSDNPVLSRLLFLAITIIRVVIAFLPGEPVEIGAGYAFGGIEGAIISTLGIAIASITIFLAVRRFGRPLVELFFTPRQIDSVKIFKRRKGLTAGIFLIFLIPGTPKDIFTYLTGLTPISLKSWLFISVVGRFPSVISSTVGGSLLSCGQILPAVILYAGTALLGIAGYLVYKRYNKVPVSASENTD